MGDPEVIQNPTTMMWLVGLGVVVVSGLHILLYRIIGMQIVRNTKSIDGCVPRPEYEASIKATDQRLEDIKKGQDAIWKSQDAMWNDIKKLLTRRREDRGE